MMTDSEFSKPKSGIKGQERISNFLVRLFNGDRIPVAELQEKYGVTIRTIQRDADMIRYVIGENRLSYELKHDLKYKDYRLIKGEDWSFAEVLAILKIIIGSRSLKKSRVEHIKAQLLSLLSAEQQVAAKRLIADTWLKYNPVHQDSEVLSRLSEFSEYIENGTRLRFTYHHSIKNKKGSYTSAQQLGTPLSIYFAEFYFYVVMYVEEADESRIFCLDRFDEVHRVRSGRGQYPRDKRVDVGSLRNQTYLLPGGKKINYKFRYWAYPQTALDKLPNSRVTHTYEDGSVDIEGNDLGSQGAMLWVMSQGKFLKVERPKSLIKQLREELKATLAYYPDEDEE